MTFPTFHAETATQKDAKAYLKTVDGLKSFPPDGHDLATALRCLMEAQALAGEPFAPHDPDNVPMLAEQKRWYDQVAERIS